MKNRKQSADMVWHLPSRERTFTTALLDGFWVDEAVKQGAETAMVTFGCASAEAIRYTTQIFTLWVVADLMVWHWWVTPRSAPDVVLSRGFAADKDDACRAVQSRAIAIAKSEARLIEDIKVPWANAPAAK
jgi:hypothetical protein